MFAQMIHRRQQITDVGGKVGVGEVPLAGAETGEVKAQYGDAVRRQAGGHAGSREDILGATETVRPQRIGSGIPVGQVQSGRQLVAVGTGEGDFFAALGHGFFLATRRVCQPYAVAIP